MAWPPIPADVRKDLRRSAAQIPDDDVLPFIEASVSHIETGDAEHPGIGPHQGGLLVAVRRFHRCANLVLPYRAASVQSVLVDGLEVVFEFDPDESPRVVNGPFGPGRVRCEYTAPTTVPADVERAAIALAAHLWLQARPGAGSSDGAASPMGYAVPNRVWGMVSGYALSNEEVA